MGWRGERQRHSMAARGIKTGQIRARGVREPLDEMMRELHLTVTTGRRDHLPLGEYVDARDINSFMTETYKIEFGVEEYSPPYGHSGEWVSPPFDTLGELEMWWNKNKDKVAEALEMAVLAYRDEIGYDEDENGVPYDLDYFAQNITSYDYDGPVPNYEIIDALERYLEPLYKVELPKYKYINAYELDRSYGGAEEGGWYYNSEYPIATIKVPADNQKMIDDAYEKMKKLHHDPHIPGTPYFDSWSEVNIEGGIPVQSPQTQPRYS